MPLKRQRWDVNQRIDAADLNNGSTLAYANLSLALRHFLAPSLGIVRGGDVTPVANTRYVTIAPLAGVAATGPIIVESPTPWFIDPNGEGLPRIDLLYVTYGEALTDQVQRYRIAPADGTVAQVPTHTTITASATIGLDKGTAATNPVAPATPTNALPIATIRVEPGSDPITADKITRVEAARFDAIREIVSTVAVVGTQPPWQTPFPLPLEVPDGFRVLVLAAAVVTPHQDTVAAAFVPQKGVRMDIIDPLNSGVSLGGVEAGVWASQNPNPIYQTCPTVSLVCHAVLTPPDVPSLLAIKLGRGGGATAWGLWQDMTIDNWRLTAVVL